jgi:8-oxo-dGTP pyrophosphatase MutT (NUDIX family)
MGDKGTRPVNLTEEEIKDRLARALAFPRKTSSNPRFPADFLRGEPRPAAVLIPFLQIGSTWHILYTRRVDTLPEHSGQVAFPGGHSEPSDASPEETALREAHEEIGLNAADVVLLGRLAPLVTNSNYRITPVVSRIPWPYPLRLEQAEVSRAFTIPFDWLVEPAHHEVRLRNLHPPHAPVPVIYFQIYDDELLWGVSAQITLNLLEALEPA